MILYHEYLLFPHWLAGKLKLGINQKDTCMENFYTSYTKKIQATTYYFVKKFVVFPDLKDVPPILEGFGMHQDFDTACSIAAVDDSEVKKRLLNEIESSFTQAKIIDLNDINFTNQKVAGL